VDYSYAPEARYPIASLELSTLRLSPPSFRNQCTTSITCSRAIGYLASGA